MSRTMPILSLINGMHVNHADQSNNSQTTGEVPPAVVFYVPLAQYIILLETTRTSDSMDINLVANVSGTAPMTHTTSITYKYRSCTQCSPSLIF
jgi:hypothetical protein